MTANTSPTFWTKSGIVYTDFTSNFPYGYPFGDENDYAEIVLYQPDGKILVIGRSDMGSAFNYDVSMARYNSDGSPDTSFGIEGKVVTVTGDIQESVQGAILQPDGKIIVAGGSSLARYNGDGSLDTTFSGDGRIISSLAGDIQTVGIQSDGKILVAGQIENGFNSDMALVRYNADGSLDLTFGNNGQVLTNYWPDKVVGSGSDYDKPYSLLVQQDGKILIAGWTYVAKDSLGNHHEGFQLTRYNSDGSFDSTFGINGKVVTDFSGPAQNVSIDANGKILLLGKDGNNLLMARYNGEGSLDTSFGNDGKVMTPTGFYLNNYCIQPDGKILVVGYNSTGNTNIILIRYNSDGTKDTSFGSDGVVTTDFISVWGNSTYDWGEDVTVQTDGKILVAGYSTSTEVGRNSTEIFATVRYNSDGSLDTTFGSGHSLNNQPLYIEGSPPVILDNTISIFDAELSALNAGTGNYAGAVVTLSRDGGANAEDVFGASGALSFYGSKVFLGVVHIGTANQSSGYLSITFNENATQARTNEALSSITYFNRSEILPSSVLVQWSFSDGNTGAQGTGGAMNVTGRTLVNITGVNDAPTFSVGDGKLVVDFQGQSFGKSILLQPNGKILAAGSGFANGEHYLALARYGSDAIPDPYFSTWNTSNGKITTSFGVENVGVQDVTLQLDGKILVAAGTSSTGYIARYQAYGELDTSFGQNGILVTSTPGGNQSVLVQSDGKILVVSGHGFFYETPNAVLRYNYDGSVDTSFGTNGKAAVAIGFYDEVSTAVLQDDGRILLVGTTYDNASRDFFVVRFNSDGSLDSSFSQDGKLTTAIGAVDDFAYDAVLQSDGKILVVGQSDFNVALVRYNSDGSLDNSFGGDGTVTTDFGQTDTAYGVALQLDGKIVVVGTSYYYGGRSDVVLSRYNTDGTLDSSFGSNGKQIINWGLGASYAYDIAIQADGKFVITGNNGQDLVVARFNLDGSPDATINPVNTLHGGATYIENGSPVVLDSTVQIYDAELAAQGKYEGSSIVLARLGGAQAEDIFSGSGNLVFSNGHAILSGVIIGDLVVNGGGILSIKFNENATQIRINEALSSIAYSNSSDAPPPWVTIDWSFNDGNKGAQGAGGLASTLVHTTVNITLHNDAPYLAQPIQDQSVMTGQLFNYSFSAYTFRDNDSASLSYNATLADGSSLPAWLTFNADTRTFSGVPSTADAGSVTVRLSATDSSSATWDQFTITVNVPAISRSGTSGNDVLTGTEHQDILQGLGGNDILDGYFGADQLYGGTGNDTYIVDNAGDVVVENSGEGTDLVRSSISYTLGANLENLALMGSASINGTGNELNNILDGNAGNNTLDGAGGVDTLRGGLGDDVYIVDITATGALQDKITEATGAGIDTIQLRGSALLGNAYVHKLAATIEHLDASATGTTRLDLTGNTLSNTLTGNDGDNVLNGGAGDDTLIGGAGNDTYLIDNIGDSIVESTNAGNDLARISITLAGATYTLSSYVEDGVLLGKASVNLIGNGADNVLTGNAGSNTLAGLAGSDVLSGGAGADTLTGGSGNDLYIVDNTKDVIIENLNEGIDQVRSSASYTLSDHIESLTLTGKAANATGNSLDNIIVGNSAKNILDGGVGADQLYGGTGNDTYIVDNAGDVVVENSGEGTDLVRSSISYTLGANLENLALMGSASINGTGNELNNILDGNAGNNTLDGAGGVDTLRGGLGDDVYIVDITATGALQDKITEATGAGIDTIQLRGSALLGNAYVHKLAATIEHLDASATGTTRLDLTGNTLSNTLIGNDGDNVLNGGAGNDTLIGGAGADRLIGGAGNDAFVFRSLDIADVLVDFAPGNDRLVLDHDIFAALGLGSLSTDTFVSGANIVQAQDANDRIIYDTSSGKLYYDADGVGGTAATHFATLSNSASVLLTNTNIFVE